VDQTLACDTGCRGFCEVVLSDDGDFLRRYHEQRGDNEISVTSWHAHPGIGEVREVKFLTHTKVIATITLNCMRCSAVKPMSRSWRCSHGGQHHC